MLDPFVALAPVILPVMVPNVQEYELAALAFNVIFELAPLHIVAVDEVVIDGMGLTVTVIVLNGPTHPPPVDVGVIIYGTVPAVAPLGLVNV